MSAADQGPLTNGLVERVKHILFQPGEAWDQIQAEPATVKGLYVGYACILAAIEPIAQLIGGLLFGYHVLWMSFRPSLAAALSGAVVGYVLSLAGVFVLALIIDALAPTFGGARSQLQAFKVAVYASTAVWIAGVFALVPPVAGLAVIGIYSLYLLYLGVPKLMKPAADKASGYSLVVAFAGLVIFLTVALISDKIAGSGSAISGVAHI